MSISIKNLKFLHIFECCILIDNIYPNYKIIFSNTIFVIFRDEVWKIEKKADHRDRMATHILISHIPTKFVI